MSRISLAHGSGGTETSKLIQQLILNRVPDWMKNLNGGVGLDYPDDSAALPIPGGYVVTTIDAYTVSPIFFPGGDLGKLAAAGTINDLLMLGGRPVAVLDAIVVEEGVEMAVLSRIADSMLDILRDEGVCLVGGDIKVMPRGQLDGVVVATAGIGFASKLIVDKNIEPGDKVIVTGPIGEHGAAILAAQQKIESSEFKSDVSPLTRLMLPLIESYIDEIHAARDPTRGGVAMALNDWAKSSNNNIIIHESEIPVREPVANLCEMMGVDPLSLASEGTALLAVSPHVAEEILERIFEMGYRDARIIGEVREKPSSLSLVVLKTLIGGSRILEPPSGEIVPRIC
ncbi:MAG: hydrogenase expression/formation protein HypE [Nitrososphaerota archaeon]